MFKSIDFKALGIIGISTLLLFVNFQFNLFGFTDDFIFKNHERVSESLVVGRLVKAQSDGMWSKSGALGRYAPLSFNTEDIHKQQAERYFSGDSSGSFNIYPSGFGLQGIIYASFGKVLISLGVENPSYRLDYLRGINSLICAFVFALIFYLLYLEFGYASLVFALLFTITSRWMLWFSHNLYWILYTFFLPFTVSFYLFRKYAIAKKLPLLKITVFVTFFLIIRFLCGYEFLTSVMLSVLVPIVYYAVLHGWKLRKTLVACLYLGIGAIGAFLISTLVHIKQLQSSAFGSFSEAFNYYIKNASERTTTSSVKGVAQSKVDSVKSEYAEVVDKYWNSIAIDLDFINGSDNFRHIFFSDLILTLLALSALVFIAEKFSKRIANSRPKLIALLVTTWISILVPLSWFILGKNHSYIHTHINNILWFLPFLLLMAALMGKVIFSLIIDNKKPAGYIIGAFLIVSLLNYSNGYSNDAKELNEITAGEFTTAYDGNFEIYIKDESIYYISKSDSADQYLDKLFFLHLYPLDASKGNPNGFINADFVWKDNELDLDFNPFSSKGNYKVARVDLPKEKFRSFITGQYTKQGRIWQTEVNFKNLKKEKLVPFDLSDNNWIKGISQKDTAFFIENNVLNRNSINTNDTLIFNESGKRKITRIIENDKFLNIFLEGEKLNPETDGYPNEIIIVKTQE